MQDQHAAPSRRPRARSLRRRVRPRACREERGRAQLGARLGADQRARVRDLPRDLRAGEVGRRSHGRGGGVVRRGGLRTAHDEHGSHGHRLVCTAEFKIARREDILRSFSCPRWRSPARACTGSRSRARLPHRTPCFPADTERMLEAYLEYVEAARGAMRPGATCHDVHRAVSAGFLERGYRLGHVTGHSIGMTMIEFPKIGEGRRDRGGGEHGVLDAPARDRPERGGLPVHAGDVAGDRRGGCSSFPAFRCRFSVRIAG